MVCPVTTATISASTTASTKIWTTGASSAPAPKEVTKETKLRRGRDIKNPSQGQEDGDGDPHGGPPEDGGEVVGVRSGDFVVSDSLHLLVCAPL